MALLLESGRLTHRSGTFHLLTSSLRFSTYLHYRVTSPMTYLQYLNSIGPGLLDLRES